MAIKLDEVFVAIQAETKAFRREMKRLPVATKGIANDIKKQLERIPFAGLAKNIFSVKGALGAAAGAAGLGFLVKSSVEAADSIAKLSSNLGIESKLLQELQFAAQQTGVSQNDLNASLLRFNRRLAEASQGNAGFKKAYDQLGISLTDGNGKLRESEEVLFEVADRVSELGSESEQASTLFTLFGDSGFRLVNLFKGGSPALRQFQRQAAELGIVLDDDLLASSEKLSDQFGILSKALSTQVTSAVLELAPEIQSLTELFIDGAKEIATYVKGISELRDSQKRLAGETGTASEKQGALVVKIQEAEERAAKYREQIERMGASTAEASLNSVTRLAEVESELEGLNSQLERNIKFQREQQVLEEKQASASRKLAGALSEQTMSRKELLSIQKDAQDIVSKGPANQDPKKIAEDELKTLKQASDQKLQIEGDLLSAIQSKKNEVALIEEEQRIAEIERLEEQNEFLGELGGERSQARIDANQRTIDSLMKQTNKESTFYIKKQAEKKNAEDALRKQNLDDIQSTLGITMSLTKGHSKEAFEAAKALQTGMAVMRGLNAVQAALAAPPGFPFNLPAVAAVTAKSVANVAAIQGTGFNKGIDELPGIGNRDTIPAKLTPGEGVISAQPNKRLNKFLDNVIPRMGPNQGQVGMGGGETNIRVMVEFDADRAVDFLEAKLVERGILGTSIEG